MNWVAVVWFALMIFFIFLEASTVSLVSTWFAVGALGAMITALCGGPVWLQCVLFFLISVALLIALRPFVKKYLTPRLVKTNVDAVIGTTGMVLETIDNDLGTGRVKLAGMEWSARSSNGQKFDVNTRIRVDKVEGVKVFVSEAPVTVK